MQKTITGLKITTTNEDLKAMKDIGGLWEQYFQNGHNYILKELAISDKIYAVYTNYKGDYLSGDYDYYLGVESSEKLENYEQVMIQGENFKIYEGKFKTQEDTLELWKKVWSDEDIDRAYNYDIEEYNFSTNILKIYISLK